MALDFTSAPSCYLSDIEKVSALQRRIIVFSIMYYDMNESCISDADYDELAYMIVKTQNEMSDEELKKTTYYYVMYDFDGSTGFHLKSRLTQHDHAYISGIASIVYHQWIDTTTLEERQQRLKYLS